MNPVTSSEDPYYCNNDRSVTQPGPKGGPFTFEFMTPEEKDDYGSATTFVRVPEDPTLIEKSLMIEEVIMFYVRYNPEKDESYLLERRIWAD